MSAGLRRSAHLLYIQFSSCSVIGSPGGNSCLLSLDNHNCLLIRKPLGVSHREQMSQSSAIRIFCQYSKEGQAQSST